MCACRLKPTTRVISLDITGTIVRFAAPIGEIYQQSALKVPLPNPPSALEIDTAFRNAFKDAMQQYPCYGFRNNMSERDWWFQVVRQSISLTGRQYSENLMEQYCRRVYQAFGSPNSYRLFEDTLSSLKNLRGRDLCIGVLTNSPQRTLEDTLPLLGLDEYLDWFVSSLDIGYEKPDKRVFDHTYELLRKRIPSLKREEIIHVGDNYNLDYLGARNAGFRALLLGKHCFLITQQHLVINSFHI